MNNLFVKIKLSSVIMIALFLVFFWMLLGSQVSIFEKTVMSIILLFAIVAAEVLEYYKSTHKISLFIYLLLLPVIVYGCVFYVNDYLISSRTFSGAFIGMLFMLSRQSLTENKVREQIGLFNWVVLLIEYGLICYVTFLEVF